MNPNLITFKTTKSVDSNFIPTILIESTINVESIQNFLASGTTMKYILEFIGNKFKIECSEQLTDR
jgi:hypothetical protein